MAFSNKLFILLSLSYPIFSTCNDKQCTVDVTMQSQLYCNWMSRIYEPKISLVVSHTKKVHNVFGVIFGLAILICYAFSFAVTILSLSIIAIHYCIGNSRKNYFLGTSSVEQDWFELKQNTTEIFILILIMFQYSVFHSVTSLSHSGGSLTYIVAHTHRIQYQNFTHLTAPSLKKAAALQLLLLLAGDVEVNPGPNGKEKASTPKSTNTGTSDIPSTSASSSAALPSEANDTAQNTGLSTDSSATSITQAINSTKQKPPYTQMSALNPQLPIAGSFPLQFPPDQSSSHITSFELEDKQTSLDHPTSPTPLVVAESTLITSTWQNTDAQRISIETHTKLIEEKDKIIEEKEKMIQEKDKELNRLKAEIARLKNKQSLIDGLKLVFEQPSYDREDFDEFFLKVYEIVEEYVDPVSCKCFEHQQAGYCSELRGLLSQLIPLLSKPLIWNRTTGFSKPQTLEQSVFLVLVNQLLRFRQEFDFCPHCCCHKDERRLDEASEHPSSHIWPSILFKEYHSIHRFGAHKFILDVTDGARPILRNPSQVKLKMLCAECERDASDWENQLSQLYVFIMSKPKEENTRQNNNQWLNLIFATILLRGLFVNCNFLKHIRGNDTDFLDSVYDLQQYVTDKSYQLKKRIYLFLLPNSFYKDKLHEDLYLLEKSIRNPQFTTLIQTDKEGSFLYTQFDCFHCVYPVCQKSVEFFRKTYFDVLPSLTQDTYTILPDSMRRELFPQILITINRNRANKLLVWFTLQKSEEPATIDECTVFIKLGQAVLRHNEPRISKYTSISTSKSAKLGSKLDGLMSHQQMEKCRETARHLSIIDRLSFGKIDPLKAIGYIKLKHNMKKFKDKLEVLRTKRDRFTDNMESLMHEIEELKDQCKKDQREQCEEIEKKCEDLEQAVEEEFYHPFEDLNSIFHSEEEQVTHEED